MQKEQNLTNPCDGESQYQDESWRQTLRSQNKSVFLLLGKRKYKCVIFPGGLSPQKCTGTEVTNESPEKNLSQKARGLTDLPSQPCLELTPFGPFWDSKEEGLKAGGVQDTRVVIASAPIKEGPTLPMVLVGYWKDPKLFSGLHDCLFTKGRCISNFSECS